jgi:hypothetical protein
VATSQSFQILDDNFSIIKIYFADIQSLVLLAVRPSVYIVDSDVEANSVSLDEESTQSPHSTPPLYQIVREGLHNGESKSKQHCDMQQNPTNT